MKQIIAVVVSFFIFSSSYAQLTAGDYESATFSPGLFGGKWSESIKNELVITSDSKQVFYKGDRTAIFDKASAAIASEVPSEKFNINLDTDKVDMDFTLGKTWKSKFTVPARKGARCPENVTFEFNSISKGEKTVTLVVNGKESEMRVVTVESEGTWKMPTECKNATGRGTSLVTFAPELGLIVSAESIGYFGSMQVSGTKLFLREFKK